MKSQSIQKRSFDIFFSLFFLILFTPILLLSSLLIVLSSPGSPVFISKRVGSNKKLFKIFKLRTMHYFNKVQEVTSNKDNRVFPFGSILRLLKIDETPQFLNILKGDMSVVGPRPEDISFVKKYNKLQLQTLDIRPGLLSPGTLFYFLHCERLIPEKDTNDFYVHKILPIKLALDLYYLDNMNLKYDIQLIIKTAYFIILKVLKKEKIAYPKEFYEAKKYLNQKELENLPEQFKIQLQKNSLNEL